MSRKPPTFILPEVRIDKNKRKIDRMNALAAENMKIKLGLALKATVSKGHGSATAQLTSPANLQKMMNSINKASLTHTKERSVPFALKKENKI